MSPEEVKASRVKHAKETEIELKKMYRNRLKDGWTLGQIDEMDIHFYLSLFKEEKTYIDEIKLF